jgi:hypothetical protein
MNYLKYYDLERYLCDNVREKFTRDGIIDPVDFYLILIWKANRAKNRARNRLATNAGSFAEAVKQIAAALNPTSEAKDRLAILIGRWQFRVATATAILTVLYPSEFTVCDARVCEQLYNILPHPPFPKRLSENNSFSNRLWEQYKLFKKAVQDNTPAELSLRDKDTGGRVPWSGVGAVGK